MSKGKNDFLSLLGVFFLKIYLWKLLTMWNYFSDLINVHGVFLQYNIPSVLDENKELYLSMRHVNFT